MIGPQRFQDKIIPEPNSGCWLLVGSTNPLGYGQFRWNGKTRSAHRVAYALANGSEPDGLTLDHKCRVRCCVNPAHLEPVSLKENILRGSSPQAINARKDVCIRGHELIPDHRGNRYCKTCAQATAVERQRRYQMRHPERVNAAARRRYWRGKSQS